LEDLDVDMKINIRERVCEDLDWLYVAQDSDQRWDVVNNIMKFQVPQKAGNFLTN